MGAQDTEEKMRLIRTRLSLSNITECYMGRKLKEDANVIRLQLSFLRNISTTLSIGFNLN